MQSSQSTSPQKHRSPHVGRRPGGRRYNRYAKGTQSRFEQSHASVSGSFDAPPTLDAASPSEGKAKKRSASQPVTTSSLHTSLSNTPAGPGVSSVLRTRLAFDAAPYHTSQQSSGALPTYNGLALTPSEHRAIQKHLDAGHDFVLLPRSETDSRPFSATLGGDCSLCNASKSGCCRSHCPRCFPNMPCMLHTNVSPMGSHINTAWRPGFCIGTGCRRVIDGAGSKWYCRICFEKEEAVKRSIMREIARATNSAQPRYP